MSEQMPLHTITDKELYKEGATVWLPIFMAVFVLFTMFSDGKKNYGDAVLLGSLSTYGLTSLAIFGKNTSVREKEKEMKKLYESTITRKQLENDENLWYCYLNNLSGSLMPIG